MLNETIWIATIHTQKFSQQKICMIDEDGVEWHRYDRPAYRYSIAPVKVVGVVRYVVEGTVPENDYSDELFLDNDVEIRVSELNHHYNLEGFFTSETLAQAFIQAHKDSV